MPSGLPDHLQRLLALLSEVRPTRDGWDACCPCPDHNQDGDQHASLRVTVGDDGRIMICCRVGCPADAVLDALDLDWSDLFAPDGSISAAGPESGAVGKRAPDRPAKADEDLCHRAYQLLLEQLPLANDHRADLRRRGLSDDDIDHRGYRSLRNVDRGRAAKAVHKDLGDSVFTVPGFIAGDFGVTLHGDATGLLVPVRDLHGHIAALKIRRAGEPKYLYLTGDVDGPSSGSPVHVPLGVIAPAPVVRVTEGELKSDVAFALDKVPTIGVPGVTQWRHALPLLKELGAQTVWVTFDAPDVQTKRPVFEQTESLFHALTQQGFTTELEVWNAV